MSNLYSNPFESMKTETTAIDPAALARAVRKQLGIPVTLTGYAASPLHGGTLGDVQMLSGTARTADGRDLPFQIVQKTQKQWERPGDPHSWRREYDLYSSSFHALFPAEFRSPVLYHAEETQGENRLWMEYVRGVSGADLSLPDLSLAAEALGRFQARCHRQADVLQSISCLSDAGYMRRDFHQWTPDTVEYQYLRGNTCALAPHLRQMLIDAQEQADDVFRVLDRLPQVLCHRDYWTENIFVSGKSVIAIDWDCAGWGPLGEDMASLIADETPAGQIGAYYKQLLPAYYRGLGDSIALPPMDALPVREMILFKFGYRLLQQLMFSKTQAVKDEAIQQLTEIYALPRAN